MENKLVPIYALRVLLLQKLNPKYFEANKQLILRSSLAAQDYVLSGHYYEYNRDTMGQNFRRLPEYTKVHKKYNLPYDPEISVLVPQTIHPGLVMDLAWSLQHDKLRNIVDAKGNIKDTNKLTMSEVLQVYHNTNLSGTPVNALHMLNKIEIAKLLNTANQNTK